MLCFVVSFSIHFWWLAEAPFFGQAKSGFYGNDVTLYNALSMERGCTTSYLSFSSLSNLLLRQVFLAKDFVTLDYEVYSYPCPQCIPVRKNTLKVHLYRPQRSWGKVIFSEGCVKNSVHGGACMVGGHTWQGVVRGRYYEIRSMSGRYASYWNAFLYFS